MCEIGIFICNDYIRGAIRAMSIEEKVCEKDFHDLDINTLCGI